MTEYCLPPSKLEALLDEISRHRSLTEDETDMLEALVTRGHKSQTVRFTWTPALERALIRVSARRSGVRDFANKHGISTNAAYKRITKIRARKGKSQIPDRRFKD